MLTAMLTRDDPRGSMYAYTHKGVGMAITRVFRNGNSQAVRIPAELAFDRSDLDVEIERVGDELHIRPVGRSLSGVMAKFGRFSADFMTCGRGINVEPEREAL
jgi:antitoxin VapB